VQVHHQPYFAAGKGIAHKRNDAQSRYAQNHSRNKCFFNYERLAFHLPLRAFVSVYTKNINDSRPFYYLFLGETYLFLAMFVDKHCKKYNYVLS
jgi:hypothetical protein